MTDPRDPIAADPRPNPDPGANSDPGPNPEHGSGPGPGNGAHGGGVPSGIALSEAERCLLNGFQRDFPLEPRPFAAIAARLGMREDDVLSALQGLAEDGVIARVGPVFTPHRAGWSTLAAMAVPPSRLAEVAVQVSAREQVNHNYEREHAFNLWFVVTGADQVEVHAVLAEIEDETGLTVMDLPLLDAYHIDLGFALP